jgi:hypothetical protein
MGGFYEVRRWDGLRCHYIPSFIKIGLDIQKLMLVGYADTQHGDRRSLPNFMELSRSWENASCAATQELPNILMELEGSLPCSQESSTCPYPEPYQSSPHHLILSL